MEFRDVDTFMFQMIILCAVYLSGYLHGYAEQKAEAKDD